jgi:hypothetical protein
LKLSTAPGFVKGKSAQVRSPGRYLPVLGPGALSMLAKNVQAASSTPLESVSISPVAGCFKAERLLPLLLRTFYLDALRILGDSWYTSVRGPALVQVRW